MKNKKNKITDPNIRRGLEILKNVNISKDLNYNKDPKERGSYYGSPILSYDEISRN